MNILMLLWKACRAWSSKSSVLLDWIRRQARYRKLRNVRTAQTILDGSRSFGSRALIIIPRMMQPMWSRSFPVTCNRPIIPLEKMRMWWLGITCWQRELISLAPYARTNHERRCRRTPWWSWWSMSGVIAWYMFTYGSCSKKGWNIGLMRRLLQVSQNNGGSELTRVRASRMASISCNS